MSLILGMIAVVAILLLIVYILQSDEMPKDWGGE